METVKLTLSELTDLHALLTETLDNMSSLSDSKKYRNFEDIKDRLFPKLITLTQIKKKLIDSLDKKYFLVLHLDEYREKYPDQEIWENGDYLILLDADEVSEAGCKLMGAYVIEVVKGSFQASWLPIPEEPFTNIDKFIEHLNNK